MVNCRACEDIWWWIAWVEVLCNPVTGLFCSIHSLLTCSVNVHGHFLELPVWVGEDCIHEGVSLSSLICTKSLIGCHTQHVNLYNKAWHATVYCTYMAWLAFRVMKFCRPTASLDTRAGGENRYYGWALWQTINLGLGRWLYGQSPHCTCSKQKARVEVFQTYVNSGCHGLPVILVLRWWRWGSQKQGG